MSQPCHLVKTAPPQHKNGPNDGMSCRLGLDMSATSASSPWWPQITTINDKQRLKLPFMYFLFISFFYTNMIFLLHKLQYHINVSRWHPGTQKEAQTTVYTVVWASRYVFLRWKMHIVVPWAQDNTDVSWVQVC